MGMRLLQSSGDAEIAPGYVLTMRDAVAADVAGDGHTVVPRETVFDFGLLHAQPSHDVTDQKLRDLKFVIFDTETTGLMPDRGDEVCQIAAMRVVKGKLVREERLDTLVNPNRPIPLSSTNVHGITDAMVKDAPDFQTAAKAFHDFADGAVLVAHNAPFDMAFFYRRQAELGLRFDHPVLDVAVEHGMFVLLESFDEDDLRRSAKYLDRDGDVLIGPVTDQLAQDQGGPGWAVLRRQNRSEAFDAEERAAVLRARGEA